MEVMSCADFADHLNNVKLPKTEGRNGSDFFEKCFDVFICNFTCGWLVLTIDIIRHRVIL